MVIFYHVFGVMISILFAG